MSEHVRKSLSFPDGNVSCLEWPGGGPPLHFAHATGFNAEAYRSLLDPLSRRFRVFASDARGHGSSTLPADPARNASWAVYRDDLARSLDKLDARPIVLAGHSMGATTSLMAAALHPRRVAGVVLVEPVMMRRTSALAYRVKRMLGPKPPPGLAERAAVRRENFASFDAALNAYRGRGAFKSWPEEMLVDYLKGGLKIDPATGEAKLACTPAWEAATFRSAGSNAAVLARKITCPITVIFGTINSTCGEQGSEDIARSHPGTRVVRVEGASHFLPMEREELVREEISRLG